MGISTLSAALRLCGRLWRLLASLAGVILHVGIVVALIYAEFFKKVVFEAVCPRGALGLIRAAVIGADRVQRYLQLILWIVRVRPAELQVGLIHPHDAIAVPGVLYEAGIIHEIPVLSKLTPYLFMAGVRSS